MWVGPASEAPRAGPALSAQAWAWSEVLAGVATLDARLTDTLVPQMLNYESIGGVNFKKGCYPGQEVVARSQFRGTLKRRTYLATLAEDRSAEPAEEVFVEGDAPDQPSGIVVQAAQAPQGGTVLLLVLQVSRAQAVSDGGARLHLGSPEGPLLLLSPLPYALLEDI